MFSGSCYGNLITKFVFALNGIEWNLIGGPLIFFHEKINRPCFGFKHHLAIEASFWDDECSLEWTEFIGFKFQCTYLFAVNISEFYLCGISRFYEYIIPFFIYYDTFEIYGLAGTINGAISKQIGFCL